MTQGYPEHLSTGVLFDQYEAGGLQADGLVIVLGRLGYRCFVCQCPG